MPGRTSSNGGWPGPPHCWRLPCRTVRRVRCAGPWNTRLRRPREARRSPPRPRIGPVRTWTGSPQLDGALRPPWTRRAGRPNQAGWPRPACHPRTPRWP
ncbi:hypothetical protein ACFFX0_00965 [Citricoccus parietis]|uniref:Uncharacterized protein n=1 Tax=Citricoccus parietis TaxID=592307 RepID=A0ABV5FTQ5_9MICC